MELTIKNGFKLNEVRNEVINFSVNDLSIASACYEWLTNQYYSLSHTLTLCKEDQKMENIQKNLFRTRGANLIERHVHSNLLHPYAGIFNIKLGYKIINDYK